MELYGNRENIQLNTLQLCLYDSHGVIILKSFRLQLLARL